MEEITLGVIIERIDNLKDINQREHKEMHDEQKKTNGSVASLKLWRAYLAGALAVISAIIVPMALMMFSSFLNK